MSKYIIDVPKNWVDITKGLHIPIEKGWNVGDLRIDTGLKLTPYNEPDEEVIEKATHESWLIGKKEGVEEAWEFAMKCLSMDGNEFCDVFNSCDALCLTNLSYQEAKAKYESWKKFKDEIRVGDEVVYHGNKYVVGYVGADEVYHIVDRNWIRVVVQGDYQIFKTGRHFNEVEEMLNKMKEQ